MSNQEQTAFTELIKRMLNRGIEEKIERIETKLQIILHNKKFNFVILVLRVAPGHSFRVKCMIKDTNIFVDNHFDDFETYIAGCSKEYHENNEESINTAGQVVFDFKQKLKKLKYTPKNNTIFYFEDDKTQMEEELLRTALGDLCDGYNSQCCVCHEFQVERETSCGHTLCYDCQYEILSRSKTKCPMCRERCLHYTTDLERREEEEDDD